MRVIEDCVTAADPAVHEASMANVDLTTAGRRSAEAVLSALAT